MLSETKTVVAGPALVELVVQGAKSQVFTYRDVVRVVAISPPF